MRAGSSSQITAKGKTMHKVKETEELVFVYGSLRRGLQNHHKLESGLYRGEWRTDRKYFMTGMKSGAYPYVSLEQLHEDQAPTHIHGELYGVSDDLLRVLDALEGHPTQYMRQKVDLVNDAHGRATAYMYILESSELLEGIRVNFKKRFVDVPHGDWVRAERPKSILCDL
jgi:gamma-glutamylaminecyclotransferase